MATNSQLEAKDNKSHDVPIFIDTKQVLLPKGNVTVAELKQKGGVPAGYELEEKINGKLVPLDDKATVEVKGGEHFFSHPRDGASS
ncbi:MAG: hypothetical protein JWO13_3771 [Acidobacteriales bacterium]|nr:hypothetical protein [Terriglobales bacterium]